MHDFAGETVLVFGGGAVGARKSRRFAREARVIVVGPAFPEGDYGGTGTDGSVEFVRAAPAPNDIDDWIARVEPALAIAATDDSDVNEAIGRAAREHDVLVNRADHAGDRDIGSVVVPATVRDDPVAVAISTGGRSPALSRELRKRIEAEIEGAGAMAELTADLRTELKREAVPPAERRDAIRAVVQSSHVWKGLRTGANKGRHEAERVISKDRGETQ